jgi:hypothetical protein
MEEMRNAYRILVGESEGKKLLARLSDRRVDNIKIFIRDIGWKNVD